MTNSGSTLVTLPNPWVDEDLPNDDDFGQRLSQWALRPQEEEEDAGSSGGNGGDESTSPDDLLLSLNGDTLLKVSLGHAYWNEKITTTTKFRSRPGRRRNMELVLEVTHVDTTAADDDDGKEEKIIHSSYNNNNNSSRRNNSRRRNNDKNKKAQQTNQDDHHPQKPIWIMNCRMGDEDDDDTPLVLSQDVSYRPPQGRGRQRRSSWTAAPSTEVDKEWLEVYHMKAITFVTLLRRLIRWGYAVGWSSPLEEEMCKASMISGDDMTTGTNNAGDPQFVDFIMSQCSLGLLTTWWMQEAGHHLLTPSNMPTATAAARLASREFAIQEIVAPKIARHISLEPSHSNDDYMNVCCCLPYLLWWRKNKNNTLRGTTALAAYVSEEEIVATKLLLIDFLSSDTVAIAMEMKDDQVTKQIEENYYEMRMRKPQKQKSGNDGILGHSSGDHTYDTNTSDTTFHGTTSSGFMSMEMEVSPTPGPTTTTTGRSEEEKDPTNASVLLTSSQTFEWLGDGPTSSEFARLPSFVTDMSEQAKKEGLVVNQQHPKKENEEENKKTPM